MHVHMEIQTKHILEVQRILIGGNSFDKKERIPFIKNLESRDLLAVPGSGKTTALQAKLYCLSKLMPFQDRTGVLVLSHTNKAVSEIEKNLKSHCPELFDYPNYVGTVQSFANKFIANIECCNSYGSYIHINNKDIYDKEAIRFYNSLIWKKTEPKGLRNKLFGKANIGKNKLTFYEKEQNTINLLKNIELNLIDRKIIYNNKTIYSYEGTARKYYCEIENWKKMLYSRGLLNFNDSFSLSRKLLSSNEFQKTILRNRFKYIFIDEAQDLDKYQLDIIDSIFATKDSECILQRIGDVNQSIYNSTRLDKAECDWKPRKPLYLNSSIRLTKEIAKVVDSFTIVKESDNSGKTHKFEVDGQGDIGDVILPHLVLFDNDTISELKTKFEELIYKFKLFDGLDGENTKKGFKIIGWSGTWNETESNGRLRLENIFPDEYKVNAEMQKRKNFLYEYLITNSQYTTLKYFSDNIIEALCAVLRIAGCMMEVKIGDQIANRYYTKSSFWKFLTQEANKKEGKLSEIDLLLFKSNIYLWSFSVATNQHTNKTQSQIKLFIKDYLTKWCNFPYSSEVHNFLKNKPEASIDVGVTTCSTPSISNTPSIPISVNSVHSVKGQTHCATMYVETSYYKYESEKLLVSCSDKANSIGYFNNPLLGQSHNYEESTNTRAKETMKMMYVGFSRPTHLLCFAMHKDNYNEVYNSFFTKPDCGWITEDLTAT